MLSTVTSPWHVSSMVLSPWQSNFSCEQQSRRKGSRSGKKGGRIGGRKEGEGNSNVKCNILAGEGGKM